MQKANIRSEFPDIDVLKRTIAKRRAQNDGWPNVVINTTTKFTHRPDISGPLSIFCNLSGESICAVDNRSVKVGTGMYFLTNAGQNYSLDIQNSTPTETFNIHFGERFTREVLHSLFTSGSTLLAEAGFLKSHDVAFHNRLHRHDERFEKLLKTIYNKHKRGEADALFLEEQLYNLLLHLLQSHRNLQAEIARLPLLKSSTRQEIYRRLTRALDYIHSTFPQPMELEEMAAAAFMSKFHFLRLFKSAFGMSPHQYIQQLRMEQAQELLRTTNLPVTDISEKLGFENAQSFSRLFHQRLRVYPTQFRVAVLG
ncbi:MAG TPA: AraC family transcriptional regulator [Patescibacteria group bacterium]|nr:AraC family transcriptional regulator [Patescibacteria group bacterium]